MHQHARIESLGTGEDVFTNRFVNLRVDDVRLPDGETGTYAVLTSGSGFGAVIIPTLLHRGIRYYGLATLHRYPSDSISMEFPRGFADDLEESEAARELAEETGIVGCALRRIGVVKPDTGALTMQVAVWLAPLQPEIKDSQWTRQHEGFVERESGQTFTWMNSGHIAGHINYGRISCGVTSAAWGLVKATRLPN